MKWLLLDTALDGCLAAIAEDEQILAARDGQELPGRGHAEKLLPAIEAARLAAGLALADLDALAVTIGPGSFTGIRTALSVARGLSLALRRPLWGLSTTQALALQGAEASRATVALIDARRGEVYMQAFAAADHGLGAAFGPPALLPLDQAIAAMPPGALNLVGSGAALLPAQVAWRISPAAAAPLPASLLHLARLAAGDWQAGDKLPPPPKPLLSLIHI